MAGVLRGTPTFLPLHNQILLGNALVIAGLSVVAWTADPAALPLFLGSIILASAILGVVFSIRIGGADMPVLISFLNATAGLAASFCGVIISNRLLIAGGATVAASGSILTLVMLKAMNRSLVNVFVGIKVGPGGKKAIAATPAASPSSLPPGVGGSEPEDPFTEAVRALTEAERLIIVPGFGMAMAQAQFKLVELAGRLRDAGKDVRYAIHPLAGRMPGHMHVLLAEAEVPSSHLFDIKEINDDFAGTDVALIVGACDVVNPAALDVEGTPISGMPILMAHQAGRVIVCNLDEKPGYSGVENPLYSENRAVLLFGDALATMDKLLEMVSSLGKGVPEGAPGHPLPAASSPGAGGGGPLYRSGE